MEQALIYKLRDGTADDVDKTMIAVRVMNAVHSVGDLVSRFAEDFRKLQQEYPDEIRMSGLAVIMGVSAPSFLLENSGNDEDDKIGLKTEIISGTSDNLKKLIFRIAEDIKK